MKYRTWLWVLGVCFGVAMTCSVDFTVRHEYLWAIMFYVAAMIDLFVSWMFWMLMGFRAGDL